MTDYLAAPYTSECTIVLAPTWIPKLHICMCTSFFSVISQKKIHNNKRKRMNDTYKTVSLLLDMLSLPLLLLLPLPLLLLFSLLLLYATCIIYFSLYFQFAWTHKYSARGFLLRRTHWSLWCSLHFPVIPFSLQFVFFSSLLQRQYWSFIVSVVLSFSNLWME